MFQILYISFDIAIYNSLSFWKFKNKNSFVINFQGPAWKDAKGDI